MLEGTMPPQVAEARQSFGEVAREVVRAEGGGRFAWEGFTLTSLFQPIYCVERGVAIGDEALLRAQSPDGQAVRARRIFEAMEPPSRVRFDWICRTMHLRNYAVVDSGERKLFLNVLPAAIVEERDGGRAFAELARFYGLVPERICLEILESESGDERKLAEAVAAYRDRGFSIAMDHFGRGHSNFDRIVSLRPRLVKLDRSLLRDALGDTQARRMLPSLVDMLKDAGAEVAVKGIENARDALAAIEAGANHLQGFHLGAPTGSPHGEALTRELIRSAHRLVAA